MDFDDYKLTAAERLANGVIAAPDKLTGTAQQNKALFDRLISGDGLFADKYNSLLDALSGPDAAAAIGAEDADGNGTTVQGAIDAIAGSTIRVFELSDTTDLETAQEAFEWLKAGKYPVLKLSGKFYFAYNPNYDPQRRAYGFREVHNIGFSTDFSGSFTNLFIYNGYVLSVTDGTVTHIGPSGTGQYNFIEPGQNYDTPYTPQYDGSPATKKYVDDAVAGGGGGSGVKWAEYEVTSATQIYLWHLAGYAVALETDGRIYYLAEASNSALLMTSKAKFSCAPYVIGNRRFVGFVEVNENETTPWSMSRMELPPQPPSTQAGLVLTTTTGGGMTWAPRS